MPEGTLIVDIRTRRQRLGLRQHDVAAELGIDPSRLAKWERGLEMPPASNLASLARVLDMPLSELQHAHQQYLLSATPREGYTTRRQRFRAVHPRSSPLDPNRLNVVDLFCGCGGFSFGVEHVPRFQVTLGIDLMNDRIDTFRRNHPSAATIADDIRNVSPDAIDALAGGTDLIIGGPPCQGFSSIRPFRKFVQDDPRNTLFEHFVFLVDQLRPRWFVFENVIGLLTHNRGRTFATLLQSFASIGYSHDWRVVNAAAIGLPQNRERLLVVGNRHGRLFEWPPPTHHVTHRSMAGPTALRLSSEPLFAPSLAPPVTVMDAIHDLPPVASGEEATVYLDVPLTDYEDEMRHSSERLTLHKATKHGERMLQVIRQAGSNRAALPRSLATSGFSSCYSRLDGDRPAVTLTVNFVHPASNKCIHPDQDRALTPREGARLQGFPDRFHFLGTRTSIVKQIGNAVPPLLGRFIAQALSDQW